MKKTLLFSAFSIFGLSSLAQPTIQSTDFYPSVGETFVLHQSDYVSPGSSGNNVTWDLTGLAPTATINVNFLSPDANFPGSTHNMEYVGMSNTHCSFSTNDYLVYGEETGGAVITYTDPKKVYEFPMAMGASFTDNFSGTATVNGTTLNRSGSIVSEVDGYGTLITPSGTFTNVIRVHSVHESIDEFMGQQIIGTIDMYTWFKAGTHLELATLQEITALGQSQFAANYLGGTVGLEDNSAVHPLVLYPNPAQDIVSLKFDLNIDNVEVYDLNGRSVAVDFNASNKTIDISALNTGIYYVTVVSNNNKSVQKLLKR